MVDEIERWDVAISFASKDEALAMALREALTPPYRVFVQSRLKSTSQVETAMRRSERYFASAPH
jgi:hypothetical protein